MQKVYFKEYFLSGKWGNLGFPLVINGLDDNLKDYIVEQLLDYWKKEVLSLEVKIWREKEIIKERSGLEEFLSPSLFLSAPKMVILKDVNKLSKTEWKNFFPFLAQIYQEAKVIVTTTPERKVALAEGYQLEAFFPEPEDIPNYIRQKFRGYEVEEEVINSLIEDYGEDLLLLDKEIRKYLIYLRGGGKRLDFITYQQLRYPPLSKGIFFLVDLILKKDIEGLKNFLEREKKGGNLRAILFYLQNFYMQLYTFKVLKSYYKDEILEFEKKVRNYFSTISNLRGWRFFKKKKELETELLDLWRKIYNNLSNFHQEIIASDFHPHKIKNKKQFFWELVRFSSYLSFEQTKKSLEIITETFIITRIKQLSLEWSIEHLLFSLLRIRNKKSPL